MISTTRSTYYFNTNKQRFFFPQKTIGDMFAPFLMQTQLLFVKAPSETTKIRRSRQLYMPATPKFSLYNDKRFHRSCKKQIPLLRFEAFSQPADVLWCKAQRRGDTSKCTYCRVTRQNLKKKGNAMTSTVKELVICRPRRK